MLPKMQHTKLQNAIVNAMYAATIETDLGPEAAMALLGGDIDPQSYMNNVNAYHKGVNLKMNGVKIPHLYTGERLNMQTSGNVDNGYVDLEGSVLRWLAAGLNPPVETLSKDFRQLSYSAARANLGESWRYFMGRRKIIAERKATTIFRLVLEEMLFRGIVTLPKGAKRDFYQATAAWTRCRWIGSGRLAIDGLKEVKGAILKIESGISTYEDEMAIMGKDYLEVFDQQVREMEEIKERDLTVHLGVLGVSDEKKEKKKGKD